MKKAPLLFLLLPLFITGCGNPEESTVTVNCKIKSYVSTNEETLEKGYSVPFAYKDSLFKDDATKVNKDLALLSYGYSAMTIDEEHIKDFYNVLGFDNVETHFVTETKMDTISYAFAHKMILNRNVVTLAVRGFEYDKEWSGNFDIGLEGNHHGFEQAATKVYNDFKTYLNKFDNYKLWLTGFSRGGAVTNVLSHFILSKNEIKIDKKDMYVYTFEAPKGLAIENKIAYENVFNFVNSRDLVTYVAPEKEYGLCRCGVDIDYFNSDYQKLVHDFDATMSIRDFKPETSSEAPVEEKYNDYIVSLITRDSSKGSIHTRKQFNDNLAPFVQTAFDFYYSLNETELNYIINDVKAKYEQQGYALILQLLGSDDGLYNFVKEYLDYASYQYDEDALRTELTWLKDYLFSHIDVVGSLVISSSALGNNILRAGFMHCPDINYVLIKEYAK